jgi:hypothetical protein
VTARTQVALYVIAMVAVVVALDVLFLRHRTLARLIVNVAVVAVFLVFYVTVVKRR